MTRTTHKMLGFYGQHRSEIMLILMFLSVVSVLFACEKWKEWDEKGNNDGWRDH